MKKKNSVALSGLMVEDLNSFLFFSVLAMPHGLWDLNSPTRDQTWALSSENTES